MLWRWTSRKKSQAKLARFTEECRKRQHEPVAEQYAWLCRVLKAHYRYYGVPTNSTALRNFQYNVKMIWYRVLQRHSQRARWTTARRHRMDVRFPLPAARICHPWPRIRFRERHSVR